MEAAPPGARHVPLGEGLALVRLSLPAEDVVVLRGILAGYDGIASAHGDETDVVALVTPEAMLPALEELLAELGRELSIVRVAHRPGDPALY